MSFTFTNVGAMHAVAYKACFEAALFIEGAAKYRCPVDTGNLRRSIAAQPPTMQGDTAVALVGTNVEYAAYVEFGTRKMNAQPFMGPALEAARARYA